jgi:hypothetical protein
VNGSESGEAGEGSEETMGGEWAVLWGPAVGLDPAEQCRRAAEQCQRQASPPQSPHETCPSSYGQAISVAISLEITEVFLSEIFDAFLKKSKNEL